MTAGNLPAVDVGVISSSTQPPTDGSAFAARSNAGAISRSETLPQERLMLCDDLIQGTSGETFAFG